MFSSPTIMLMLMKAMNEPEISHESGAVCSYRSGEHQRATWKIPTISENSENKGRYEEFAMFLITFRRSSYFLIIE